MSFLDRFTTRSHNYDGTSTKQFRAKPGRGKHLRDRSPGRRYSGGAGTPKYFPTLAKTEPEDVYLGDENPEEGLNLAHVEEAAHKLVIPIALSWLKSVRLGWGYAG
jgi:hypothetical protein